MGQKVGVRQPSFMYPLVNIVPPTSRSRSSLAHFRTIGSYALVSARPSKTKERLKMKLLRGYLAWSRSMTGCDKILYDCPLEEATL